MQENIIFAVVLKKPPNPSPTLQNPYLIRGIDRTLKIQPIHSQLYKLLKKLKTLKSLFIQPYFPKKESLLKELKTIQNRITELKRKHKDTLTLRRYLRIYMF
jgi:hypothetical protein